jgi:SAM-dependent methyltransferase
VSDITAIPVDDASFDYILCTEVLEHVPDAIAAIREFSRILKPGGTLLTTAPFCSLTHFAPYHFSGYNHYWWEYHLPKNGFEIETIESNGTWFSFVAQELRRSRTIGRNYGVKWLGLLTRILVLPVIFMLSLMERYDQGSDETLCFGYMIRATKKEIH